jgi:hypothetical protein
MQAPWCDKKSSFVWYFTKRLIVGWFTNDELEGMWKVVAVGLILVLVLQNWEKPQKTLIILVGFSAEIST